MRVRKISYVAHNGRRLAAYVALPAWYGRSFNPPIPLVISPHGRWASARTMVARFGRLPAIGGFALISPQGHGRVEQRFSWGYAGQIDDLARMPEYLARALPWVTIDRWQIYAVGASMGGQEALLLAARHPELLAGVASFDAITDFALQYRNFPRIGCNSKCRRVWGRPIGHALRLTARREVGGTPATAPAAYAARSPLAQAEQLAFSGASVQIWWSRTDRIAIDPGRQSGALYRRLVELNPGMSVESFAGRWGHAKLMNGRTGLSAALRRFGLLPR